MDQALKSFKKLPVLLVYLAMMLLAAVCFYFINLKGQLLVSPTQSLPTVLSDQAHAQMNSLIQILLALSVVIIAAQAMGFAPADYVRQLEINSNLKGIEKTILQEKYNPDGFNIGININEDAGQTISHSHIHIIPRYKGDVENPRGGIRGVIPSKKEY